MAIKGGMLAQLGNSFRLEPRHCDGEILSRQSNNVICFMYKDVSVGEY